MRAKTIIILAASIVSSGALGQVQPQPPTQPQKPRFMDRAEIQHGLNSAMVVANSPRPLQQAVQGVSEEYGWTVDFEDPPYYSQHDVADATSPAWRAQHPNAKGVTLINGGAFQTQYPESVSTAVSATEEEGILNKLVADYNLSGNPGKFSVLREGPGRFAVVGINVTDETGKSKEVSSILDTPISIPAQAGEGEAIFELILSTLRAQSGKTILPGLVPINLMRRSIAVAAGQNMPARALLQQVISATGRKLYWELLYDTDGKAYYLSLVPVQRAEYDSFGNRTTVFVK